VGGRKSKRSLLEVMADLEREGVLSSSQGLGYSTSIGGSGEAGLGSARGSGEFGKIVGKVHIVGSVCTRDILLYLFILLSCGPSGCRPASRCYMSRSLFAET
jgi:hypothetical protein